MFEYDLCVQRRALGDDPKAMLLIHDGKSWPKKAVLSIHGRTQCKEYCLNTMYAYAPLLAQRGYLVACVDLPCHGERHQDLHTATPIPLRAAMEMPSAIDYLLSRDEVTGDGVAVVGCSMGGVAAFAAMTFEHRVKAAVCMIAAPRILEGPEATIEIADCAKPFRRLEDFVPPEPLLSVQPPALLVQLGEKDPIFSVDDNERFIDMLRPRYTACPDRLKLTVYPGLLHSTPMAVHAEAADWIARHF